MAVEYPAELESFALHLRGSGAPRRGSPSLELRSRLMVHQARHYWLLPVYDSREWGQQLVLARVVWECQEVCSSLPLAAQLPVSSPRYGGRL
jgi:hypothetical protein